MTIINITTSCVKQQHICYYTVVRPQLNGADEIHLYEVVTAFYDHPDAPGRSHIQRMETHLRAKEKLGTAKAKSLMLLDAMNETVCLIWPPGQHT